VEKQVAILYVGTKNLAKSVPVNKIREFETQFLAQLESRMPETLKALNKPMTDEIEKTLTTLAGEVALHFA
jgi:F-type H+-transporting ATPase subunit alpha